MKITVSHKDLAAAAVATARILPSRSPMPVLAGIMITASGDSQICLSAFDYDVSIRVTITGRIGEPGQILLPGQALLQAVRSLKPEPPVTIDSDDTTSAGLAAGTGRFTIPLLPAADYPRLPDIPDTGGTVAAVPFRQAVAACAAAAGTDKTLPVLQAICLQPDTGQLVMTASDRYRLAWARVPWAGDSPRHEQDSPVPRLLVRAATLTAVCAGLGDGDIRIGWLAGDDGSPSLFSLTAGATEMTSRLIAGQFPDMASRIPASPPVTVVADQAELDDTVRRLMPAADANHPLEMDFADGDISLSAGEAATLLGCDVVPATLVGDPLTLSVNAGYLHDALVHIDGPVRLGLSSPRKPIRISVDADDPSMVFVVVPIGRG